MKLRYDGAHWQHIDVAGTLPNGRARRLKSECCPTQTDTRWRYIPQMQALPQGYGYYGHHRGRDHRTSGHPQGRSLRALTGTAEIKRFRVAMCPTWHGSSPSLRPVSATSPPVKRSNSGACAFPSCSKATRRPLKTRPRGGSELGITASGEVNLRRMRSISTVPSCPRIPSTVSLEKSRSSARYSAAKKAVEFLRYHTKYPVRSKNR